LIVFLVKIYFDFREKIWTDADESGVGISSIKIPVQCEQENKNSFNFRPKIIHYVSSWWNVAANWKAGYINHCKNCVFKQDPRKNPVCSMHIFTGLYITYQELSSETRGKDRITVILWDNCNTYKRGVILK
jgi:hypothetical protein